jgi:hypothetical protein
MRRQRRAERKCAAAFAKRTPPQATQPFRPSLRASSEPVRLTSQVLARAGLDCPFYLATKHYGVHHMKVMLGLPNHDIARVGWLV